MSQSAASPMPDRMKAAVYKERGVIQVESFDVPTPGPEDLLLRVSHCGICGTDLHLTMEGWGQPDSVGGHEYSGEVVAVGSRVRGFAPGDHVVGGATPGCGECEYCHARRPSLCSGRGAIGTGGFTGAFAEYKCLGAASAIRIPDGLSPRVAALAEPLAVSLHGITASGIAPGQRALVTGAGPIGALTLAALRARGIDDVTVSEPAQSRRELAQTIGAARVLTPDVLEIPAMPFTIVDEPFDAVFECSGNELALRAGVAQLKKAGTFVLLGTGARYPRLDTNRMLLNELVITGAYNYDDGGFEDALAMLASGTLPTEHLIHDEDIALPDLQRAMERLVAGEIGGKVMVAPSSSASGPSA